MVQEAMPGYREEGQFTVHIELSASFADEYEGESDGYVWLEHWRASVKPRLARAVFEALRADPGFEALPAPRGRNPDEVLEVAVRFIGDGVRKRAITE